MKCKFILFFNYKEIFFSYGQFDEISDFVMKNKNKIEENLEKFNYYKSETEIQMINNLDRWQIKSNKSKLIRKHSINEQKNIDSMIKKSLNNITPIINNNNNYNNEKLNHENEQYESLDNNNENEQENLISLEDEIINNSNKQKNSKIILPLIEPTKEIEENICESPYSYNKRTKFPLIDNKKKEKDQLNEDNFVIDEDNIYESLKSKIELLLSENFEIDSFTKKANFISKIVDNILAKTNKRVSDLDSILIKKNKNLVMLRKETSTLTEKIQGIKALVASIIS